MKNDKTTYKNIEERENSMTADYTSHSNKPLFFAYLRFSPFLEPTYIAHIGKSHKPTNKPKLIKE